jgi:hypothetical protein
MVTRFWGSIFPCGRPSPADGVEGHRTSEEQTVGDNKALPLVGGALLLLFLPLVVVIALIAGGLAGLGEASAADCGGGDTEGATFAWPTDDHSMGLNWESDAQGIVHQGIDFNVKKGSKVYAAEDGEVTVAANNEVRISHDKHVETRYKYFDKISVKVGDKVERGKQIGTSGSGNEDPPGLTGDHLHFEMWIDKKDDGQLKNTKPEDGFFGDDGGASASTCCGGDLSGNNNAQKAFNYFATSGFTKEQAAGIVGNMIHESGVEPARLQGTPSGRVTNPNVAVGSSAGWGIVQWTPAGKMIKPSRNAGVDDATIASLQYQLDFLRKQLNGETAIPEKNAGDQVKAAKDVESAAVAFGRYYERFAGSDDLSNSRYAERKTAAKQVLSTFGGGVPDAGTGGGCGAGSGNIAAVAKSLAWPSTGHDSQPYAKAANDPYKANFFRYNKSAKSAGDVAWTDCGRFVATVMHMSGADPDYPDVYTPTQENYLRTSGKYEVHDDWDVSKLQPGDILIGPGHTYLFVGPWANGHNSASASLDGPNPGPGHVPEASNAYAVGTTYAVARLKKK